MSSTASLSHRSGNHEKDLSDFQRNTHRRQSSTHAAMVAFVFMLLSADGCARLPYATQIVHEDQRVRVVIQREVNHAEYTHPVRLDAEAIIAILRSYSVREKKALPLRWFAEEQLPQPLFRADEVKVLAPHLAAALEQAGPGERVYFHIWAPGFNPAYARDTTAGWIAVREPYWRLTLDYYHVQLPVRKSDQYDYNYPLVPEPPRQYILSFEPGRFWVTDSATGERVLDYRGFVKSPESSLPR